MKVYVDDAEKREAIWILCEIRTNEGVEKFYRLRGVLQEDADLEALGPDHMVLIIKPGGVLRLAA